ncbi:MAG: HEAT repeat domain-containing protein, partial [Akkermansiaceae bacterium]|nr:HEAT repeat domain-containing protein [Akkermansiaceae bacterium]
TGYGKGHLNAAGTHVLTFLLLAKECGAEVPYRTLHGALRHFYRYAGRGGNPYGDGRPEIGFVDNGKNGKLAFAMAAAAALTPDGENSVYARARDVCAMQSFYTTTFMLHGHTGGGIGEIWRSAAMGLLHEKKPNQYREFMDNRQWHYDLSRRFDGSFGILGGAGYDKEQWGVAYPLAYTIPRKTLRVTGAPPTKFSKPYQLPEHPWGTEADEAFLSLEAVPDKDGRKQDLSGETLARDSSGPFLRRFHGPEQPSDDEIRKYIHHQDYNIRYIAAMKALGINSGYIGWRSPGGKVRPGLVMEFLQSERPRVRGVMFAATAKSGHRTPGIIDLAVQAVQDGDESWWVKDAALQILGSAPADQLVPLVDLLVSYLKHEEAWLRNSALTALTPVAGDERCYERVLPAMGELLRTNQRVSVTLGFAPAIRARIKAAGPDVQKLAAATLKETYTGYAGKKASPAGQNLTPTYEYHLDAIAASLADVPGGLDVLYEIARQRHPNEILPHKKFFLAADSSQFGPKLKKAIKPIIMDELIPEFVGKNRKRLRPLAAGEVQSGYPGGKGEPVDELAALYERAGHDEYDWHMFADLRNAEWAYHSFDPIPAEQVPFDQLVSRYREVTLPKGMENWFAPGFDAAGTGWKTGRSPFGNYKGEIPKGPITKCSAGCVGPECYGATKVNTLWEKEVLLMRGTFKIPPLKDGHRYRLRVNTGQHVGAGGGHLIYVNGKPLVEAKQGGGRGSGGRPKGAYITKEFLDDFKSGEVTIGIKTFIRHGAKYSTKPKEKVPQGKMSIHLDEQKLPPMGDELVTRSARVVAMLSSEWQAKLDPEDASQDPDENLFRWDGKFVANPQVIGAWTLLTQVNEIAEFDPEKKAGKARNAPFSTIELRDGGETADPTWVWSGDTLMDLNRYEALRMEVRTLGDADYLFVEAGGFSTRHKPDWKSPWLVLRKK